MSSGSEMGDNPRHMIRMDAIVSSMQRADNTKDPVSDTLKQKSTP